MAAQDGMDALPQGARPLAVDDPQVEDATLEAGLDVVGEESAKLLGPESVQIQNSIDRHP